MHALILRKRKKTGKTKKPAAAKPATGHKTTTPAPKGAVRKTRQTAKPKPATSAA